MEQKKKVVIDVQLFQVKTYFPLSLMLGNIMAMSCRVVKGSYYMEMEGLPGLFSYSRRRSSSFDYL